LVSIDALSHTSLVSYRRSPGLVFFIFSMPGSGFIDPPKGGLDVTEVTARVGKG
jgi:hypothetical protein